MPRLWKIVVLSFSVAFALRATAAPPHNVALFIPDGLRALLVNERDFRDAPSA